MAAHAGNDFALGFMGGINTMNLAVQLRGTEQAPADFDRASAENRLKAGHQRVESHGVGVPAFLRSAVALAKAEASVPCEDRLKARHQLASGGFDGSE